MHSKADAWGNKRGDNKEKACKRGTKDSYNKKKKKSKNIMQDGMDMSKEDQNAQTFHFMCLVHHILM